MDPLDKFPSPSFAFWAEKSIWTHDEAVSLLLGTDPRLIHFKWLKEVSSDSAIAKQFLFVRQIVKESNDVGEIPAPCTPAEFLKWAERHFPEKVEILMIQIFAILPKIKELIEDIEDGGGSIGGDVRRAMIETTSKSKGRPLGSNKNPGDYALVLQAQELLQTGTVRTRNAAAEVVAVNATGGGDIASKKRRLVRLWAEIENMDIKSFRPTAIEV